ncbi:MAG: hypothetical protein LBK61_10130, partial [Spirochaetaceae bacterium]|nr:hypothetical protein [Spirochaetaceae bacterium]
FEKLKYFFEKFKNFCTKCRDFFRKRPDIWTKRSFGTASIIHYLRNLHRHLAQSADHLLPLIVTHIKQESAARRLRTLLSPVAQSGNWYAT